jgi:hypothetical protein
MLSGSVDSRRQTLGRILSESRHDVGVGVERGRDGGMSETFLDHLGMDPSGE